MLQVIGIKEAAGDFQGTAYHNVNLHCTAPALDNGSFGQLCEIVKIKFDSAGSIFGKIMGSDDWKNLIGKNIDVCYDKYGRVNFVREVTEPQAIE